jgi:hypothetical protein
VTPLPPAGTAPRLALPVKDPYVADLLGILQETKSTEAFLTTLDALVEAKPDHRQVVPAIIRNAERIGIYGGANQQISSRVGAAIRKLTQNNASAEVESMLQHSEDLRALQAEWRRFWLLDNPSHLTPQRVYAGIGP